MAVSTTHSGLLVVQDERFSGHHSVPSAGRQMLMPILLGLGIPGVAVGVLAPDLLSDQSLVFGFYLMTIFVISAVIFIRSIFNPGSVVEATFDARSRTANFVRIGTFATTNLVVPFREIDAVSIEAIDDGGYKSCLPLVVLKNGESLELPEGTSRSEIEAIRSFITR